MVYLIFDSEEHVRERRGYGRGSSVANDELLEKKMFFLQANGMFFTGKGVVFFVAERFFPVSGFTTRLNPRDGLVGAHIPRLCCCYINSVLCVDQENKPAFAFLLEKKWHQSSLNRRD